MPDSPDSQADDVRSALTSPTDFEMMVLAGSSMDLMDSVHDLLPEVMRAAESHHGRPSHLVAEASSAAQRLSEGQRTRLRGLADDFLASALSSVEGALPGLDALAELETPDLIADPIGAIAGVLDLAALARGSVEQLGASHMTLDELAYLQAYLFARTRSDRRRDLRHALFLAMLSSVEPLLSRLMSRLLAVTAPDLYPGAADPTLIKRVRQLTFGGPINWRESLVERLGLSTMADAVPWTELDELWEMRNTLLHRGGFVDPFHSQRTGLNVGPIELELDAVRRAADLIGATRLILTCGTWMTLNPLATWSALGLMDLRAIESLREGRWARAAVLARAEMCLCADPARRAGAAVNEWLAREGEFGPAAIEAEVRDWDTTGLPETFALAQLVLLHRDEEALARLSTLINSGSVTHSDLVTWPLFTRYVEMGAIDL